MGSLIVGDVPKSGQPVLFLDFDDVLNVARFDSDVLNSNWMSDKSSYNFDAEKNITVNTKSGDVSVNIRISSEMISDIKKLLDDGIALLWLTSWKSHTRLLNEILGLSDNASRSIGYVDWRYRGFSDDGRFGKVEYLRALYRFDYDDDSNPLLGATNRFVSIDDAFLTPIIAGAFGSDKAVDYVNDGNSTSLYTNKPLDGFYGHVNGMSKVSDDVSVGYGFVGDSRISHDTIPFMSITPDFRIGLTKNQLSLASRFLLE